MLSVWTEITSHIAMSPNKMMAEALNKMLITPDQNKLEEQTYTNQKNN